MKIRKSGFTLIELLVVIAIIAILAAILFPVFAQARERARVATCTSNVKQIAIAVLSYVQDNDERFPMAWGGQPWWGNQVQPYIKTSQDTGWQMGGVFHCPSDNRDHETLTNSASYGANACVFGFDNGGPADTDREASESYGGMDSPARLVAFGETCHMWYPWTCGGAGCQASIATDWIRPGFDMSLNKDLAADQQTVVDYFNNNDFTDGTPGVLPWTWTPAWGNKGPAYNHGRTAKGTGYAMMGFADGHVNSVKAGRWNKDLLFPRPK